jgi:hypothetical protein
MPTYCGNNLNNPKLINGTHVLGSNYQCMKKGIGVGSHLPYDISYAGIYAPVDPRRFYCGNDAVPPVAGGYLAVGSPSKCLQIGIGVGKSQRAGFGPPSYMYFIRHILPYVIFFTIISIIFMCLYFIKPKFITNKDDNNNDVIDYSKFVPYLVIASLVTSISIWWFWKRFVRRWI